MPAARSVRVENAFTRPEGGWELVLTVVDNGDEVGAALEAVPDVSLVDADPMGPDSDVVHLIVLTVEDDPFVLDTLLESEAIPAQIRLADDQLTVRATVRDWDHLKELGRAVERAHGTFELLGVTQTDHPGLPFGEANLTYVIESALGEEQVHLLEMALERGFFEQPRRVRRHRRPARRRPVRRRRDRSDRTGGRLTRHPGFSPSMFVGTLKGPPRVVWSTNP